MTSRTPLPPGTQLNNGAYGIRRFLGSGGFGITYQGRDTVLDRPVAIKEFFPGDCVRVGLGLHPGGAWTTATLAAHKAKFFEEGRALAKLHHPGIVQVYSVFEENDTVYLVMQFVEGQTVENYRLAMGGQLPVAEAIDLIRQAGDGLIEIHAVSLLHRDIKPSNIMRRANGRIVLIDFGAAREFITDTTLTHSVVLTRGFAPPEQYTRKEKRGAFTDVYALAATLYCLLTGEAPTDGSFRAMEDNLPSPRDLRPDVPAAVSDVVMRGLRPRSAERPATIEAFLSALDAAEDAVRRAVPDAVMPPNPSRAKNPLNPREAVIPEPNQVPIRRESLQRTKSPNPVRYAPSPGYKRSPMRRLAAIVGGIIVLAACAGALYIVQHPGIPPNPRHTHDVRRDSPTHSSDGPPSKTEAPPPQLIINPVDKAEMVYVPVGAFIMGSGHNLPAESPKHTVYLDGYYIAKYPVTVAQYRKFTEATGRDMPREPKKWGWDKTDYPMVNVSWNDAKAYARWAHASLPTEAQWEKAARGTDGLVYPWGNTWVQANARTHESGILSPASVDSFPDGASPYGAQDMAGNVFQWCSDWYDENYYSRSPHRNPKGPAHGDLKVIRGGSWFDFQFNARTTYRYYIDPGLNYNRIGFRIARKG